MAFKVQVGPPQIAIHQGQTVLVTAPDGQISWPSDRGLYFCDTRVISAWAIYANGEPWDLLNGGAVAYDAARIFLTNRAFATEDGPIAARTLGLVLGPPYRRRDARGPRCHQLQPQPVRFNLEIAIRCRFRRHLRGEVQPHRAPRPHHHRGREPADACAPTYRNKRFLPRADRPPARRATARRRCTPTDG